MYTSLLISLIIAVILAPVLVYGLRRPGPGPLNGLLFIFIIILMFSWAIGGWIEPIHPLQIRYSWLSYLLIGFFIMLLLGALLPPPHSKKENLTESEMEDEIKAEQVANLTIGFFFWIMLFSLALIGIAKWF